MRKSSSSVATHRKQTSKSLTIKNTNLFTHIETFYKQISSITLNQISGRWFDDQQQALICFQKKLSKHKAEKMYDYYKTKLESARTILNNIDENYRKSRESEIARNTMDKVNQTDMYLKKSTKPSQLICNSIQKLKQTICAKETILHRNYEKEREKSRQLESELLKKKDAVYLLEKNVERMSNEISRLKQERNSQAEKVEQEKKQKIFKDKANQEIIQQLMEQKINIQQLNKRNQLKLKQEYESRLSAQEEELDLLRQRLKKAESQQYQQNEKILSKTADVLKQYEHELKKIMQENTQLRTKSEQIQKKFAKEMNKNFQLRDKIELLENRLIQQQQKNLYNAQKMRMQEIQIEKKANTIQELLYEKQNYCDGYAQLKQNKVKLEQKIQSLNTIIQQLNRSIGEKQQQNSLLHEQINNLTKEKDDQQHQSQKIQDQLNFTIKELRFQIKQCKLQTKNASHKSEMYMEKYYQLKQNTNCPQESELTQRNNLIASKNQTYRNERQNTNHSQQDKSTEKHDRKLKVLSDLKDLVKTHKMNITASLR